MELSLKDIRESGLLELYVLDDIDQEGRRMVEQAINKFPELKDDIQQIEKYLQIYAGIHAIQPPQGTWENIKSELSTKSKSGYRFRANKFLLILVLVALVFMMWKLFSLKKENSRLSDQLENCEEEKDVLRSDNRTFAQLKDANNIIVPIESSSSFPETDLYIHNNVVDGKVFLQINVLPDLKRGETFQLWSLKENTDPIPLDLFESDTNKIIEVTFEQNTLSYAITIEPEGGSQVPSLDKLIGVFNL